MIDWLNKRKKYVTATEIASIVGLNKFKSAAAIKKDKVTTELSEFTGNSFTYVGNLLEPVVVNVTNDVLKLEDFERFELCPPKYFLFNDEWKIGATPDAENKIGTSFLECKTTRPKSFIYSKQAPSENYVLQGFTQLMLDGKDSTYLSIMSTDLTQESQTLILPIVIYKINFDDHLKDLLIEEVSRFWQAIDNNKAFKVSKTAKNQARLYVKLITEQIYHV